MMDVVWWLMAEGWHGCVGRAFSQGFWSENSGYSFRTWLYLLGSATSGCHG